MGASGIRGGAAIKKAGQEKKKQNLMTAFAESRRPLAIYAVVPRYLAGGELAAYNADHLAAVRPAIVRQPNL